VAVPDSHEWTLDGHAGRLVGRTWFGGQRDASSCWLNGRGEHVGRFEHVAAALVANGAVDHVCHGKSEGGFGPCSPNCEPIVDDLHEVDRRAREEHPDLPVVLIGHSMGGLIAVRYGQRYTDSLAAVVLSGPLVEAKAPAQLFDPSASPWPRSTAAPPVRTRLHLTRPATA